MAKKMNHYEFVCHAIKTLRTGSYKGIHSVYSGFNGAFRKYFDSNPVDAVNSLEQAGKIVTQFARGGVMIYLPGEAPERSKDSGADKALKAMGLATGNTATVKPTATVIKKKKKK